MPPFLPSHLYTSWVQLCIMIFNAIAKIISCMWPSWLMVRRSNFTRSKKEMKTFLGHFSWYWKIRPCDDAQCVRWSKRMKKFWSSDTLNRLPFDMKVTSSKLFNPFINVQSSDLVVIWHKGHMIKTFNPLTILPPKLQKVRSPDHFPHNSNLLQKSEWVSFSLQLNV